MKILVIIPAYNEGKNIKKVVSNLKNYYPNYDYLVVNDCSNDNTARICRLNNYNYLSLPINLGIGGCVQTGFMYAYENNYDIAIQMDGDGQHDAKYLNDIIKPICEQNADIVIGSRFITNEGFQSSNIRRFGISFLSLLIKICSGIRVKDVTSGFRAINRKFLKLYSNEYSQDYPEPEAIISGAINNGKIKEVSVIMRERNSGKSSINFSKSIYYMIKVSISIIIFRITYKKGRSINDIDVA